jgi:ABC-type proline/glycine betaine transport system ATPase subunit
MSGGEQQMLVIGRALMSKPRLLLLDEPSLGVAPKVVQDIARSIVAINRDEKVSVLLVEQNSRMALRISQRAYALTTGAIALSGNSSELLNDERVKNLLGWRTVIDTASAIHVTSWLWRAIPDPKWPNGALIAVQIVLNYEEGGENNILHGDAASEAFLSEIVGAAAWPGQRHWNMESMNMAHVRASGVMAYVHGAQVPLTTAAWPCLAAFA